MTIHLNADIFAVWGRLAAESSVIDFNGKPYWSQRLRCRNWREQDYILTPSAMQGCKL